MKISYSCVAKLDACNQSELLGGEIYPPKCSNSPNAETCDILYVIQSFHPISSFSLPIAISNLE